jgi:hypothetical protein
MSDELDRGFAGEQSMGFYFGKWGYFVVDGPSGAGGHRANGRGFDGVAYNPKTTHLVIYDNKAYKDAVNAGRGKTTALRANLLVNLDELINMVANARDMPHRIKILSLLHSTRHAAHKGTQWPGRVHIAVSNASGRVKGVTKEMDKFRIRFLDFNSNERPDWFPI